MQDSVKPGRVIRQQFITRAHVRANRNVFYLFGDNMAGKGFGGQAAEMRGERNAIGVPTKFLPSMKPEAFFSDDHPDNLFVRTVINDAFVMARAYLKMGYHIVIPADGLGTGRAELPQRAPKILALIEKRIAELESLATVSD